MSVTRITFIQTFPTGMYANQKIGIETEIDNDSLPIIQSAREKVLKEMFEKNKKIVEDVFVQMNPHINWNEENIGMGLPLSSGQNGSQPTITQVEKPIRDTVDNIIEDINTCKELKTLESYKLIAKTNSRIMEAYQSKLNLFTV